MRSLDQGANIHVVADPVSPLFEQQSQLFSFSALPRLHPRFEAATEQFGEEIKQAAQHFIPAIDELLVLFNVVPECFEHIFGAQLVRFCKEHGVFKVFFVVVENVGNKGFAHGFLNYFESAGFASLQGELILRG